MSHRAKFLYFNFTEFICFYAFFTQPLYNYDAFGKNAIEAIFTRRKQMGENNSNANANAVTKSFLDSLYKNVKMGADSIIDLLPKVTDESLRHEMTRELEEYERFAKEISDIQFEIGETPNENSFMKKAMTKMGIAMNTMTDTSTSHIADMMIQGATMGVTDTTKLVREHENTTCSERALSVARNSIKFEEESIENLKKFL